MIREGRMDMATVTAIILAVLVIAIVSIIVFKISGSGDEKGNVVVDSLDCVPKVAQACMINGIDDNEVDGRCITEENRDTICDTV
ncbi:MAG: hypothetical protein U9O53_02015 [archaeon]|nr:hypothetical protein [archaeon]